MELTWYSGGHDMNKLLLYCFGVIVSVLITNTPIHAWQFSIEVSAYNDNGVKVYNRLVAGTESGATDGFDNLWDTPALINSTDPENEPLLRAYFTPSLVSHSQGSGFNALWKDIRGPVKGKTTWDITVDSVPEGKNVVVAWNMPQGMLKAGDRLVLMDNDKVGADDHPVQTDVTQASNYVFISDGEGARSLSLVLLKESSGSSRSGGGSGFGCGTVKSDDNTPPNSGTSALGIVVLLMPMIFLKLRFAISRH
jgi:hypothetical protein